VTLEVALSAESAVTHDVFPRTIVPLLELLKVTFCSPRSLLLGKKGGTQQST